jgi:hypothetical protein
MILHVLLSWKVTSALKWRNFLHVAVNNDRWQEVTFRYLVTLQAEAQSTECFITTSGISEVCSSGAKSHTGDESMSVKKVHIQVLNLSYKCSICPSLVTRQTSIL